MVSRKEVFSIVLAVAVIVACAMTAHGQGKPAGTAPVLVIDKAPVDLGDRIEGEDFEYTYHLSNKGNGELRILSVRVGCGCTTVDYTKVIPPGQEGTIKATVDGRKIFPGYAEKTFRIQTNDSANADFMLTLRFTIKKVLDTAGELNWTGFENEPVKLQTVITDLMSTPINIKGFEWSKSAKEEQLDQKLETKLETIEKGRKYKLTIMAKKGLPLDRYFGELTLQTDYPKVPTKTLTFHINVMKDVVVYPERIFLGEMAIDKGAGGQFDKVFNVVSTRGDTLKILKVVPSSPEITVKLDEQTPGKSFKGTVSVRPPDKPGQYKGSITIYTNYPKYKELALGIVGNVR